MIVRSVTPDEHPQLLTLLESALRPGGGPTRVVDDFPVALSLDNRQGLRVLAESGSLQAGLACLIRPFRTSLGEVVVGAIGSVATRIQRRGQGLSRRLQADTLDWLRGQGAALAVLWSEHPEWYAGPGFRPAGLEYHVDLAYWQPSGPTRSDQYLRPFRPADVPAVSVLYASHPYVTLRRPNDAVALYTMPGTSGWVATNDRAEVTAYVFCGKGADFANYVLEWGGTTGGVIALLKRVKALGLATRMLIPQGCAVMMATLGRQGAVTFALNSGLWCVVDADRLRQQTAPQARESALPRNQVAELPEAWLGGATAEGRAIAGPLELAVWGFDSV